MSFEELWKKADKDDEELSSVLRSGLSKLTSKDPLEKLKRNLLISAVLGILIAAGYVFILAKFPVWQVFLCIGIVLVFTVWASVKCFLLYNEMGKSFPQKSILQVLESHYEHLKKWMLVQQQVGLFIYPVSATGGFMIGGSVGAGKSITEVMQKPVIIIALIITLMILVPLCYFLAKWMCNLAYGKYIKQLKQNIEILKSTS